ncbi:hypothetical protein G7047_22895 [Diaphorobacter sp. HDW4A]|uniref:hypothetical protein n=1 Tax=Diaphorobacter sp. HDW4A TaxID=2714924 RepID=UPI00140B5B36|nr:hypothetical protein [Diaphorobacter sp. HDW4A]QIL82462.1 hypothetical protein G7047_22895 [Diaphorobacter sp. HDW4A]
MKSIFEKINELSSAKIAEFNLGKFEYAFIDKDPIFVNKLLPLIGTSLAKESFQADVMRAYTEGCMNEKAAILKEFEAKRGHPTAAMFYTPQLDLVEKRLAIKTIQQLIDHLKNYLNEYPGTLEIFNNSYKYIHNEDGSSYIEENYVNYRIGCILYSKHQSIKGRIEMLDLKYSKVVESEYEKIGIDIRKEDTQFSKYSLVSLNNNIQIFNDKDSQTIRDERIGRHFWINVPRKLLSSIEALIEKGMLSEIAFRIDYISKYVPAMEEMEFGAPLRLKISSLPKLSKFYSTDKYENNLWIHHDAEKLSLTFEELMEDFEVAGDDIVTQVIHLEYSSKDDDFFITHLDHEFIIYTLDSYQERLSNANIKGHRKIKTFKIDNSMIPFNISIGGDLFLLQVLDSYFKNDDLIREYFEKIN